MLRYQLFFKGTVQGCSATEALSFEALIFNLQVAIYRAEIVQLLVTWVHYIGSGTNFKHKWTKKF